jgi:UrcA family protein
MARTEAAAARRATHRKELIMRKFMLAAAAFGAFAATSAQAAPAQVKVLTGVIRYSSADVASPSGADRLLERISLKATRLCAPSGGSWMQAGLGRATYACRDKAVARAVRELDAPLVTAAYERGSPTSVVASR